jgi:hypothetical protein
MKNVMNTQLYLARGIVAGRVHTTQDSALLRTVELGLESQRARGRGGRRVRRGR